MLPTVSIGSIGVGPKLVQSQTSGSLHRDAPRAVSCCPPPSSRTFHRCRAPCHGSRSCNGVVHINTSDAFNLVINWQMLWPMSFVLRVEHLDTWGHFRPSPRLCHDSRHLQSPAQLWSSDRAILELLLGHFSTSLFAPSSSLCLLVPLTTCSLFSQHLTSSLPSSASTTSANAPHRDSRLPSSFKHHSWRSPPVLCVTGH